MSGEKVILRLLHCTLRGEQDVKHLILFIFIMYNWRRAPLHSYSLNVKLLTQDLQETWINGLGILNMQHANMAKKFTCDPKGPALTLLP